MLKKRITLKAYWAIFVLLVSIFPLFFVGPIMTSEAMRLGRPYVCCMPDNYEQLYEQALIARPHYESTMMTAFNVGIVLGWLVLVGTIIFVWLFKFKQKWLNVLLKSFIIAFSVLQMCSLYWGAEILNEIISYGMTPDFNLQIVYWLWASVVSAALSLVVLAIWAILSKIFKNKK